MSLDERINSDSDISDSGNNKELEKNERQVDWSKFEVARRRRFFSFFRRKKIILFIHGFSSSFASHDHIFNPFVKKGYRFFSFNFPAHGESIFEYENGDLTLNNFVQLAIEFIKFHKLKNIILVGHSMGGAIATIVRSLLPERIQCLILEDPLNKGAVSSKEFVKFFFRRSEEGKINLFHPIRSVRNSYKNNPDYKKVLQDILSQKATKLIESGYEKLDDCPTLLIFGENDHVINPQASIKYISSFAKKLTVKMIPDAKHSPSKEQPELFLAIIDEYIKNLHRNKLEKGNNK